MFPREVLARGAVEAAPRLLGAVVETRFGGVRTAGRIVETEAYLPEDDRASHSAAGATRRNASMFLEAGRAYVYLIYGMHECFNVVTGDAGRGEAVLIRALEPLEGLGMMRQRRGGSVVDRDLARGPGRLTRALGISRQQDGLDMLRSAGSLLLHEREAAPEAFDVGPRVGITKDADLPLRFRIAGCRWTS